MKTAVEVHKQIECEAAEKAVQEVRRIGSMEVGQVVRQGDIYIHRIDDNHPHGKKATSRQLALGNTQGSRHIAEAPAEVYEGTKIPEWCARGTFIGPFIKSFKRFLISHPEHAHVELPAGAYQITHQMDARTLQRVRD